jgi:hypothetical protein
MANVQFNQTHQCRQAPDVGYHDKAAKEVSKQVEASAHGLQGELVLGSAVLVAKDIPGRLSAIPVRWGHGEAQLQAL